MISIPFKYLTAKTNDHLKKRQAIIDKQRDYELQKKSAKSLWNGKSGSKAGKAAFTEVKAKLIQSAVGNGFCHYCEHGEGTDIEHIYPKNWYPEKTFVWNNYALACRTCNTDYKSNRFATFDSESNLVNIQARSDIGIEGAFIDPRSEDPMRYLWLNLTRGVLIPHPDLDQKSKEYTKAQYTLNLLSLNTRNTLISSRKNAVKWFFDQLDRYVRISQSKSIDDLLNAISPFELSNGRGSFEEQRALFCQQIRHSITNAAHQTVWEELKRQRDSPRFTKTRALFQAAPEVLDW